MTYEILESTDREELTRMVTENAKSGWICVGGVQIDNGTFYQTITHQSDGDPKPKTMDEQGELAKLTNTEPCGVCGEVGCTNKLHTELAEIAEYIGELRKKK